MDPAAVEPRLRADATQRNDLLTKPASLGLLQWRSRQYSVNSQMPNPAPNVPNETETIRSASDATFTLFWGHNGDWWDVALIISLIVAAGVAAVVGIATAGSIFSHKKSPGLPNWHLVGSRLKRPAN